MPTATEASSSASASASASTQPDNKPKKENISYRSKNRNCTYRFHKVRRSPTYVDKTLIIKELFDTRQHTGLLYPPDAEKWWRTVLFVAPRHSGKSTIMSMLQSFLQIQVDTKTGKELPREDPKNQIHLFEGLEIMKHPTVVDELFGQFPIIRLKFPTATHYDAVTQVNAEIYCKFVVKLAFMDHAYLKDSKKLSAFERNMCRQWLTDTLEGRWHLKRTLHCLKSLSRFLHTHYGKKPLVLIDDYDLLPNIALKFVCNKRFGYIVSQTDKVMSTIMNYSHHVVGGIMFANSYVAETELPTRLRIHYVMKFLKMECYDKFFGVTKNEMKIKAEKFHHSEEELNSVMERATCYTTSTDEKIYSLPSYLDEMRNIKNKKKENQAKESQDKDNDGSNGPSISDEGNKKDNFKENVVNGAHDSEGENHVGKNTSVSEEEESRLTLTFDTVLVLIDEETEYVKVNEVPRSITAEKGSTTDDGNHGTCIS